MRGCNEVKTAIDNSLCVVMPDVGFTIVGAGVSTCAFAPVNLKSRLPTSVHSFVRSCRLASSMRRALLGLIVLVLAVTGVGCPCVRSAVNASPELRWWLFSNFGASKICPEMLKRGVPLKLQALGAASVGRFFPRTCYVQVDDRSQAIVMSVSGTGYAMLPLTRRVGFSIAMSVEYRPDFRMEPDAVYIWGRFSRFMAPPDLRVVGVENPIVNLATKTPAGDVATLLGQSIVAGEIGKGFTVVHRDDGDDFAIGHMDPPEKPTRPYQPGEDHVMLATDLTEVHGAARDYLGPFEVGSDGAALFVRARVTGGPVIYALVTRDVGEAWRRPYEAGQPASPPPGPLVAQGAMPIGDANLKLPVARGSYYLIVENQAPAPLAPLGVPLPFPEPIAYVSYGIEIGDR